jgi:hypothetical protein
MAIPVESMEVERCYLTSDERVVQVLQFLSNGSLSYRFRWADDTPPFRWTGAVASPGVLPFQVLHEVPCDWPPKIDE